MDDACTVSTPAPHLLKWDANLEPRRTLPGAQTPGTQRATYPFIKAQTAAARYVLIGPGQSTPRHSSSSDHFIVSIDGQVEFRTDSSSYRLGPRDILFIPANLPYTYSCVLPDLPAFFLSVQTLAGDWPPTNWYETGEQGSALA